MLKHILLWKFKQEYKNADLDSKINKLNLMYKDMIGKVEGLISAEIGKDISGSEFDIVLFAKFKDKESLEKYKTHPLHQNVKNLAKDWVTGRTVFDYYV